MPDRSPLPYQEQYRQTLWLIALVYLADLLGCYAMGTFALSTPIMVLSITLVILTSAWLMFIMAGWLKAQSTPGLSIAKQQELFDTIKDAVLMIDQRGLIQYYNRSFEQLIGYDPGELIGQPATVIVPDISDGQFDHLLGEIFEGHSIPTQGQLLCKDGTLKWVRVSSYLTQDPYTRRSFAYGMVHDITEEIANQRTLEQERKRFEFFVESLPLVMWIWQPDGTLSFVNQQLRAAMQMNMEEMQAKAASATWMRQIHPDDVQHVVEALEESNLQSKPYQITLRMGPYDPPQYRWYQASGVPLLDEDGMVQEWYGVGMDIDELIRTQQQLKDRERLYRSLVESPETLVMRCTPEGKLLFANQALQQRFFQRGTAIGSNWVDLIHPDDLSKVHHAIQHCLGQHKETTQLNCRLRSISHSWRYVSWELLRVQDEEADQFFLQGIGRDDTNSYHNEQDRARTMESLIRRNECLNEFAYMVSHNLRAPLANVQGMAELLSDEIPPSPANQNMLDYFQQAISHLEKVIESLQHALDTQHAEADWQLVSLQELFQHILEQLKPEIEKARVTWQVDFQEAPSLHAPWTYLHNTFYNLLSNAIKFRSPERDLHISVHTQQAEGAFLLTIEDNGQGMDLAAIGERLFQRGERFHPNTEGTGTGLYLVRQQIKRLGGDIQVESSPGQGTKFRLRVPSGAIPEQETA